MDTWTIAELVVMVPTTVLVGYANSARITGVLRGLNRMNTHKVDVVLGEGQQYRMGVGPDRMYSWL